MVHVRRRELPARWWCTALLLLGATACGRDGAECLAAPCPMPIAVRLAVQDSASTSPITNASIAYTGPSVGNGPCVGALCYVSGGRGTYEIDVSAPGYRTMHEHIVVSGAEAKNCGCASTTTQQVTVALVRAG